jgi:lysophospholipase L1-like esterase
VLFIIPVILLALLEFILYSGNYGNDYTTFVKISEKFQNYKFFNPALPQKYFGKSPITPSVIPDGFKEKKEAETFRIFALGGSTTAGFPHPPNGSFPRLLKKMLQKNYPNNNFEVINLGISAVNSITIRDIIDDVLSEFPDLILFYAGHNEYYGAMGPASNVNGFNSAAINRFILNLKDFKTVQLIENTIAAVISIFKDENSGNKTLMSQIAGRKLVPIDSELFEYGIKQYMENVDYIFSQCNKRNIPVIAGTLFSNLLQPPLCKFVGCDSLVAEFDEITKGSELDKNQLNQIKEEDNLRFRAPERFNEIMKEKSEKYQFTLLDLKQELEEISPDCIIGYNLMMDHLHPTYEGNYIIAKAVLEFIEKDSMIKSKSEKLTRAGKAKRAPFKSYTKLDSVYTYYTINYLLNDFPFVKTRINPSYMPATDEESIALEIINGELSWEEAHIKMAQRYLERKDFINYVNEINTLIDDKPFDKYPYLIAIEDLKNANKTNLLEYVYLRYFDVYPELSVAINLADIYFEVRNYNEAIYYYERSISVKRDARIFFNLSACYYSLGNIEKAIENIENCLKMNSNYPNADKIYNSLKRAQQTKK